MTKNIYVISDVELGQGDNFDDFKDEAALIRFINRISDTTGENLLIFNGDTFDFLKMPFQENFTHHITEKISLWKINRIIETYPKIFQAMKSFLQKRGNNIIFIIGNHDLDLIWPSVQERLQKVLNKKNLQFIFEYENEDVHIEHGHQVDYLYKVDRKTPFLKYKGQTLLNIPFGYMAVTKYFIELKKEFPIEEKLYPRHQVFESFPEFRKKKQKIGLNFLFKGIIFNFMLNIFDPISKVPYFNLIKHLFDHGLEFVDESKFIKKRFNNLRKLYPDKKVYLMGHLHIPYFELNPNKEYFMIATDTWREEIKLHSGQEKVLKPKTYAHLVYNNDKLDLVNLLTFNS